MTGFICSKILHLLQRTNTKRGQTQSFERDCEGIGGWKSTGQLVSWLDFGLIASEDAIKDSAK